MNAVNIADLLSDADAQSRLSALAAAYFDLEAGEKVVTAAYSQGDGTKSVTYTAADKTGIARAILMLKKRLGLIDCYPRARRIYF